MNKTGKTDDEIKEWHRRLWWVYGHLHQAIAEWGNEATLEAEKHARLAHVHAKENFYKWIAKDIEENHSKELRKYVKAEERQSYHIKDKDGKYINDINEIIGRHTEVCGKQWMADDDDKIEETEDAIKEAIDSILNNVDKKDTEMGKTYTPEGIRAAANQFKAYTSIGVDGWSLRGLEAMLDCILEEFGVILAEC